MKAFDHALLIGGAATALLAGAATAQFGLAPIHQVLAGTAPSLDTTDPAAPQPIQADLASDHQAAPPAVIVPVSAPTRRRPPSDAVDDQAPKGEEDTRQADVVVRDLSPELNPASEADPEVRDADQDRDPPTSAPESPSDDPAPLTPG